MRKNNDMLRKVIRDIISEGLWDDIKAGAGKAYDVVKTTPVGKFLGMQNKDPSLFYSYLDDLSDEDQAKLRTNFSPSNDGKIPDEDDFQPLFSLIKSRINPFSDGKPGEVTQRAKDYSKISFSSSQFEMMDLIEDVLRDEGFDSPAIAAAIVNAYAESGFNPNAAGDGGHSIGLFQLNDAGGAGTGMSVSSRRDPVINTRRIAQVAKQSQFMNDMDETDHIPSLAASWSKNVERPSDTQGEMRKRARYAELMFGLADF